MHTTGTNTPTGAYAPAYAVTPLRAYVRYSLFNTGVNALTGVNTPAYVVTPLRG